MFALGIGRPDGLAQRRTNVRTWDRAAGRPSPTQNKCSHSGSERPKMFKIGTFWATRRPTGSKCSNFEHFGPLSFLRAPLRQLFQPNNACWARLQPPQHGFASSFCDLLDEPSSAQSFARCGCARLRMCCGQTALGCARLRSAALGCECAAVRLRRGCDQAATRLRSGLRRGCGQATTRLRSGCDHGFGRIGLMRPMSASTAAL